MRNFCVALLGIGLLTNLGCSRENATGISVDRDLRKFIPQNTIALLGVEAEKIRSSPLYKRHANELNSNRTGNVSKEIGFDPRRDISKLIVAWDGRQPLVIAKGEFTEAEVEKKAQSRGAKPTEYHRHELFEQNGEAFTFLTEDVIALGRTGILRQVIDQADTGAVPEQLAQRLRSLPAGAQIWIVSQGELPLKNLPLRQDIRSALSNIVGFVNGTAMSITVDTGIKAQADISCISAEGAQRVRDALRGGIGLARLAVKDGNRDLLRLYDAIDIKQNENLVHVNADINGSLVDQLLKQLPALRRRAETALPNAR